MRQRSQEQELVRRVEARHAAGGLGITAAHMDDYGLRFEPPTLDELALYDGARVTIGPGDRP